MKSWLLTTGDETEVQTEVEETLALQEKCTKQFALTANKKQKCLSYQRKEDPYTAENVIRNTKNSKLMFNS